MRRLLERRIVRYYRISYGGACELVSLFVGTKIFSHHICYKNSKILTSQERHHGHTELNNMLVMKSVLNEIIKVVTFTQGLMD